MPCTTLHIYVRKRPGRQAEGILRAGHLAVPCALGRTGLAALKREGDGASPRGVWPLRALYFRADRWRVWPPRGLATRQIGADDGWCDAPLDRNYNRAVRHPYPASAERLWRDDHLYDAVVVVGYNDRQRARGRGSAIFIHLAKGGPANFQATEGCVALRRADLRRLLGMIGPRTRLFLGV